ncbi:MAG: hypothetical protein KDC54_05070 [Lewinella sp.]|nr:hypothetical protein [Lewinella sp.]
MFSRKHRFLLADGSVCSLFGEDYFADKKVFWGAHQSELKHLCQRVCATGFPLQIEDLATGQRITITTKDELDGWWLAHQPTPCLCEKDID